MMLMLTISEDLKLPRRAFFFYYPHAFYLMTTIFLTTLAALFGLLMLVLTLREKQRERRKLSGSAPDIRREPASNQVSTDRDPLNDIYGADTIARCAARLGTTDDELRGVLRDIRWSGYTTFWMAKRRGGYRNIEAPNTRLKAVQRAILDRLLTPLPVHAAATGFRPGLSIADNARPHLGRRRTLKTDLHDFFGSIRRPAVRRVFREMGFDAGLTKVLVDLCTHRNRLPQGAPTSPALSNLVAAAMDERLTELSLRRGLPYTRYADALTFSGDSFNRNELIDDIARSMAQDGFTLNAKKTRLMASSRRIVTGLSIGSGEKLTLPRERKREIRKNVHFVLKYGVTEHRERINSSDPAYVKRLIGELCFWRSIEPEHPFVNRALRQLRALC